MLESCDSQVTSDMIEELARQAGFTKVRELHQTITLVLRGEAGTSKINENGFGHYENVLTHKYLFGEKAKSVRFVKQ